jgi:hypothetical protein
MDTDENVGIPFVGQVSSLLEGEVDILVPGKPGVVSGLFQLLGEKAGNGEINVLFTDAVGYGPRIFSAMPRIDDDDFRSIFPVWVPDLNRRGNRL